MIRLSGDRVVHTLQFHFGTESDAWRSSRHARRWPGHFQIEGWRTAVPVDLWLWPSHSSYTGQPSAELHLVGSPPIVDAVLEQLFRDGARPARAGEFTLRAFLAGRLDLTQAEAVLGVIEATDDAQLRTALSQLAGGLSDRIGQVRESLLLDLADLEAGLDFVEEDIEFVHRDQMQSRIRQALVLTESLLEQSGSRMVNTVRPRVVLAGLPNAGKSTLYNALVGGQQAIVSDVAGTTRDYLVTSVVWGESPLDLVDTAGVDQASTGVAQLAEELRTAAVEQADLVIWCSSLANERATQAEDDRLRQHAISTGSRMLWVGTQLDRMQEASRPEWTGLGEIQVSARTGQGIEELRTAIRRQLAGRSVHHSEWLTSTAARSRDSLERCVRGLSAALDACEHQRGDELLSLELRSALEALGEVCGQVHTDDVLDRIFSRFCIGK